MFLLKCVSLYLKLIWVNSDAWYFLSTMVSFPLTTCLQFKTESYCCWFDLWKLCLVSKAVSHLFFSTTLFYLEVEDCKTQTGTLTIVNSLQTFSLKRSTYWVALFLVDSFNKVYWKHEVPFEHAFFFIHSHFCVILNDQDHLVWQIRFFVFFSSKILLLFNLQEHLRQLVKHCPVMH